MRKRYIVGLGNPGSEYAGTRHNSGFQVLDLLVEKLHLRWREDSRFSVAMAECPSGFLIKPLTFMNESGVAVRQVISFFEGSGTLAEAEKNPQGMPELYVIYDDLDLVVGEWRKQFGKHPKIHNGLNSVLEHLHTDAFWHIRLGADGRAGDRAIPPDKYVLTSWSPAELAVLRPVWDTVVQELYATLVSA